MKGILASDYSRAEKRVNGSTENFSKKHGVIPVQIGISPTLPTGLISRSARNDNARVAVIPNAERDLVKLNHRDRTRRCAIN
jgi:hypothetical protein